MKFTKEYLLEEAMDSPVLDEMIDRSRWSIHYRLIFEHEGKFYETDYSTGASEQQDEYPFQDYEDGDEIECEEVEQVEQIVKVWQKVSPS